MSTITHDSPLRWWGEEETAGVDADELRTDAQLGQVATNRLLLVRRGRTRRMPTASAGSGVRLVQRALMSLGFQLPKFGPDGDFGSETDTAVRAFQSQSSRPTLSVDGIVGAATLGALVAAIEAGSAPKPAPPMSNPVADYWHRTLRIGLSGNTVEPLIDGPLTFAAIKRAIETAEGDQHYVYLLGWWCDPWVNLAGPGTCLLDLFARAGRLGVQVRGLIWAPSSLAFPNHAKLHDAAVRVRGTR